MRRELPIRGAAQVAAVLTLCGLLVGCDEAGGGEPTAAAPPARPVLTRTVAFEDRIAERSLVGTIRPRIESDLGFRVQGKVAKRLVNVGDVVRTGQPLALLDEIDLRLQSEQAEAERRAAAASLTQTDADLTRGLTLAKQGWTTASNVDRQRAASEEARGRLSRAERALSLARNASSYAVLEADGDGVVTATSVEPGQVVAAGQTAIRLARTAEKEAVVSIPEALVERARSGRATVGLWSNAKVRYAAALRELSPAADAMTRTYLARFSMPDAGPDVQLGMTATVTLADADPARIVRLPLTALFNQGAGPTVWAVDGDGRLTAKPVTVASYEASDVLVSDGLAEGDRVVTLGVQKLDAAQQVRPVDALAF